MIVTAIILTGWIELPIVFVLLNLSKNRARLLLSYRCLFRTSQTYLRKMKRNFWRKRFFTFSSFRISFQKSFFIFISHILACHHLFQMKRLNPRISIQGKTHAWHVIHKQLWNLSKCSKTNLSMPTRSPRPFGYRAQFFRSINCPIFGLVSITSKNPCLAEHYHKVCSINFLFYLFE